MKQRADNLLVDRQEYDALKADNARLKAELDVKTSGDAVEVSLLEIFEGLKARIAELEAAQAEKAQTCKWTPVDCKADWLTDCGNDFINNLLPADSGIIFCPFCGRKIEVTEAQG